MINALDFETSRFPDGSCYRETAQAISWASTTHGFHYYTDPHFVTALQATLDATTLLVLINGKYDIGWLCRLGCVVQPGIRIWDCQLAEFVLSGQTNSFASMEGLCEQYGIEGKRGGLEEYWNAGIETKDIPVDRVEEYNVGDIDRTLAIYHAQQTDPRMTPQLHKLILLQGLDLLVLQQMEQNGIKYNVKGSTDKGFEVLAELDGIKKYLTEIIQFEHFNLSSGDHLSCFLYGGTVSVDIHEPVELVYKSGPRKGESYVRNAFQYTATHTFPGIFTPIKNTALKKEGFYQTGEPILKQLKCRNKQQKEVVAALLRLADLEKLVGSFLHAIPALAEKMGWGCTGDNVIVHPTYNQCVARTGRLSCSKPNAQQWDDVTSVYWISRYG